MKRAAFAVWLGGLGIAGAQPVTAQTTFTLDGTGSRVAFADNPGLTAIALSPGFQLVHDWRSLNASGTYAQFPGGDWSLRGQLMGSAFTPSVSRFRGELAVSAGGTLYQDNNRNAHYLANARLHWLAAGGGAWVGAGLGEAWNGLAGQGIRRAELGGWLRRREAAFSATVSPTSIGDGLRYVDWEGAFQWNASGLELLASAGLRDWTSHAGAGLPLWGMLSATYWVGPHVAVVGSGGKYPADYAQGLPHGTYVSLGLRVATARPSLLQAPKMQARQRLAAGMPPGVERFTTRRVSRQSIRLTLQSESAGSVEVMGDFTGWKPVALTRAGADQWVVTLPIPAGGHRMNIRIDGGAWGVPPGVPSLSDEFSGVVGLLVVE
jgi:hypothetical protein